MVHREYARSGTVAIDWWTPKQVADGDPFGAGGKPTRVDRLPAVTVLPAHALPYGAFVSPATARRLGLAVVPTTLLATPRVVPDQAAVDELTSRLGVLQDSPSGSTVTVERGPQDYGLTVGWIAAAACAVVVVAAAAAAVGLSRIDTRPDAGTLASIGAAPSVQRRTAFWTALAVAGLGAVVGPAHALIAAGARGGPRAPGGVAPPGGPVLALALGVPLLIASVSAAVRPVRPTSRRAAIA